MLPTANITMQFGAKPLFENVSVKFGNGNRYGLIGANGSGKSTFMKILGGDLDQSGGTVSLDPGERIGKLRQDQFAYEEYSVIDTVIMGHVELWSVKEERDRIYSLPEMSEEDGIKVADLETEFGEMDGYTAESRAGELLIGVGIPVAQHFGPMSEIAPGFKLRVLLAQALFSDPDILLLDEPTNNLDIHTIHWLEEILKARNSTMIIISHDRHFLNSVCTHMADLDYGEIRMFPGNYDEYMTVATQSRSASLTASLSVLLPEETDSTSAPRSCIRKTLSSCRSMSTSPMYTLHSMSSNAAAVAVATPCCPAPVSATRRDFPIRRASKACPMTLLILWDPVWFRSSRLRSTRTSNCSDRR